MHHFQESLRARGQECGEVVGGRLPCHTPPGGHQALARFFCRHLECLLVVVSAHSLPHGPHPPSAPATPFPPDQAGEIFVLSQTTSMSTLHYDLFHKVQKCIFIFKTQELALFFPSATRRQHSPRKAVAASTSGCFLGGRVLRNIRENHFRETGGLMERSLMERSCTLPPLCP